MGLGRNRRNSRAAPPGRLQGATSRGWATGVPQAHEANVGQRGASCAILRGAVCRLGAALASPTFFEAQGGSVPNFLKKVQKGGARELTWAQEADRMMGTARDTGDTPSDAHSARGRQQKDGRLAHTRTRARAKRTTFVPRGNRANLRTQEKRENINKRKIYIMCYCSSLLTLPGDSLRSHYVRNSLANCERKSGQRSVPTPAEALKSANLRTLANVMRTLLANASCERFLRTQPPRQAWYNITLP